TTDGLLQLVSATMQNMPYRKCLILLTIKISHAAIAVRAWTGAWDGSRPTEGAYSCLMQLDGGACASVTYSGYAHFDSDEFCGWIGEGGQRKDPDAYGNARRSLAGNELDVKNQRNYGGAKYQAPAGERLHQHFGLLIASCEHADLRPLPQGVMVYSDEKKYLQPLAAPKVQRAEVIDELYAAVVDGKAPVHDGEWALATTEACLAILRSAKEGKEIPLRNQTVLRT
ncbi:MAG TPA: hypothetical protein VIV54_09755, partial [Burkholderiales bacterium]